MIPATITKTMTSAPSTSALERLPLHVLDQVCQYLAVCDSRRRSLYAFSLASASCCYASTRHRFSRIFFNWRSPEKLHSDIEQWDKILHIDGRYHYVQVVKVVGTMIPDDEEKPYRTAPEESRWWADTDDDGFCELPKDWASYHRYSTPLLANPEEKKAYERPWMPLAQFLSRLSGLRDLVWVPQTRVPPCLLSAMHEHHPHSRLHLHSFNLQSLYQHDNEELPRNMDPDDLSIATSPCISSIAVPFYDDDWDHYPLDHHEEAIHYLVRGLAPNLRSVSMAPIQKPRWVEVHGPPRPLWKDVFLQHIKDENSKGHLQHLAIGYQDCDADITPANILSWRNCTHLEELRSLHLEASSPLATFQVLSSLAERGELRSIRQLVFNLRGTRYDAETERYQRQYTGELLQSLHPLEQLTMSPFWGDDVVFDILLHKHGQSLRKLSLGPAYAPFELVDVDRGFISSRQHVEKLSRACPNLTHLNLVIRRTQGDEHEVAIYRALGQMRSLKRVNLDFACSPPFTGGTLRDYFINSMFDASLATAIFRIISTNNSNLEQLSLEPICGDLNDNTDGNICHLYWCLRNRWVCKWDQESITVTRVVLDPIDDEEIRANTECDLKNFKHEEVWRSIWPDRTGDWRKDWSSLPLSE